MACYPDRVTEVEIPDDHQLMDADTPEMLKKLEQLAAQRL